MGKVIARAYLSIVNVNDGEKGETALTLVVTPNTFVFETDDKGNIENLAKNKGKIRMFLGQTEVVPSSISITPHNCYARIVGDNTLYFVGISPNQWSGKVEVTATCKGQTRTAIAEFMVSAQKWNEAKFLANEQQFQSIIAQNKADKQGLEKRMTTIEHDAKGIRLEVSKQTFSGVNMLKGASLRPLDLLSLQRAQYVTIGNDASVAHLDNPYVAIVRHGAPQKEWNGCKFPVVKAIGGRTYTVSMFTRIYGRYQPYLEIKRSRSKDMTDPKTDCPDIPSTWGQWKQYTHTFDLEEGYNYLQIFIGFTRDGEAYLSEVQLEEGNKATVWKDPDVETSLEKVGLKLDGKDMSINAQAKMFNFLNKLGEVVAFVDDDGSINGLRFKTKDNGGGHIEMHDNLQEYYKPNKNSPSRRIGYIGNDWVDQRLNDDGNIIWELTEQGIIYYQTAARWVDEYKGYLSDASSIQQFFAENGSDTLRLIFGKTYPKQTPLQTWYAARDTRGNIIASKEEFTSITVEKATEYNGKMYKKTQMSIFSPFGYPFTGVACPLGTALKIASNLQSTTGNRVPSDYIKLKQNYSLSDSVYYVDFSPNSPLWIQYISIYNQGECMGSYAIYSNELY